MEWSLFLLIVMGQCPFLMCHLYEYHFIEKKMNWSKAQTYCRKHYTDLATVYDMTDMKRLNDSTSNREAAWIGLHNVSGVINRTWYWSLPGVEYNDMHDQWEAGEPNNYGFSENCVAIRNKKLYDDSCTGPKTFICYDEKQTDKFKWIDEKMTWLQAQSYCRAHHTDLISGHNETKALKNNKTYDNRDIHVGLFTDGWRWSDGNTSSFRNWDPEFKKDNKTCAMIMSNKTGKWGSDYCNETKPFFCYEDKVILIKENKTWEEALYYCRENYNDLVSITSLEEQRWVQEKAKNATTSHVWLGLRYTCTLEFWFWVSDEAVTYKNWASDGGDDCDFSGAMDREGEHKWVKHSDGKKYDFICSRF